MKRFSFLPILISLFAACHQQSGMVDDAPVNPLFQLLPASLTGIQFNNVVTDSANFNIFNYRNFYNGGGVAIGDVNNDGRPDIFFTSNQHENQLYINKGNWHFEEVGKKAGITGINRWHTGVTMADVNGDGWLDIYVSNSGAIDGSARANELYINQHDGTFKEMAHEYGLDDKGIGTQAVFFDYDHDGDLDCFVLNNSFRPIESFGYNPQQRNMRNLSGGHRLYRNDHGHFTDVSEAAGIFGSEIGFGLGVTVGDVNDDGWPDLYVSNDFFEKDYLYINQHDGTFRESVEQSMGHISLASMGSDMADINNDGHLDIFTTDMLPEDDYRLKTTTRFEDFDVHKAKLKNDFHHQLESNCLQLNNGDGTFSEIACLAGVEATDWSWGALSFDFDNDGWKDLLVCNGISKDLTDQDFLNFFSNEETKKQVISHGFNYKDFINRMPVTPIPKYAFVNQHNLRFKNEAPALGLGQPAFSNGAAYGDLDGDGDEDLVVNNENAVAFVYRNMSSEQLHHHYLKIKLLGTSPNNFGIGSRVTIYGHGRQQMLELMPTRGFESSVEPVLDFGLGSNSVIDSLTVQWPTMKLQRIYHVQTDTTLILRQSDALENKQYQKPAIPWYQNSTSTDISGNIQHNENAYVDFDRERLIPKMLSTEGPKLVVADVNGDGLPDFFMGGAAYDTAKLFLQQRDGRFLPAPQYAFAQDFQNEDIGAAFFDADNDGDMDLVVASGGNEIHDASQYLFTRLYLNDGKGHFTRSFQGWPMININASCVRVYDFDGDGKPDIFIGARSIPGAYGMSPSSVLLKNQGNNVFTDVTATLAPGLQHLGMVTDAQWADLDGKGKKSLVVAGDWMPLTIFRFDNGQLAKIKEIPQSSGWWNCISVADLNGDGRVDLIAGNLGLNAKIRADAQHPAKLYVSDFDKNGTVECIPVYYKSDGKAYPFPLYGDLIGEIPSLKKNMLLYKDYAGKPMDQLFSKTQLAEAEVHEVDQTQTCVFYNQGNDHFASVPLPVRAQFSPVFAILVADLNQDQRPDLLLGGNFYGLKPESGRYDASFGVAMMQDSTGHFVFAAPAGTGIMLKGEVRDIQIAQTTAGFDIIVARNNDSLQVFKKNIRAWDQGVIRH